METPVPDDWIPLLAATVAAAIREFAPRLGGIPVKMLAVDCHPWHGSIELAVLTADETTRDGMLADPSEMASWRHYRFSEGLASWRPAAPLGCLMRAAYEAANDRRAVAEAFLRACAVAMTSPEVAAAVESLVRAGDFRISVAHPDDGREFFSHGARTGA
jgi:hypothetical protein